MDFWSASYGWKSLYNNVRSLGSRNRLQVCSKFFSIRLENENARHYLAYVEVASHISIRFTFRNENLFYWQQPLCIVFYQTFILTVHLVRELHNHV